MSTTVTDDFKRFLLPLGVQFQLICYYNRQYWGRYFSDKELEAFRPKLTSDHEQAIEDLLILHVEFGSPQETIRMWWRVVVGEQPNSTHYPWARLDNKHFKLLPSNVATYPPKSITQVRINLVSHWEPEEGRTLEEVRNLARQSDETLAHSEVMSAYGLHTELFRQQDGKHFPRSDMAGTDGTVPGESRRHALCLDWCSSFSGEAGLNTSRLLDRSHRSAAPVVRQCASPSPIETLRRVARSWGFGSRS